MMGYRYRVAKEFPRVRYLREAVKCVRVYKKLSTIVAVDSLRGYCSTLGDGDTDTGGENGEEVDRLD